MDPKLQQVAQKIERMLSDLKQLEEENAQLRSDNQQLKAELGDLEKGYQQLQLASADRSETARVKLTRILDRLEELEKLTG